MPPARGFDIELAALEALRDASPEAALPQLRHALAHRNNYLVAKAAKLSTQHQLAGLVPDLAAAFPRFLVADGDKVALEALCRSSPAQVVRDALAKVGLTCP